MKNLNYTNNIPYLGEYEVCVIGGGPAGVCAAIEAAREGKKTVIVEATGMLGGMATAALVGPFMTCYDSKGEERVVRGLFDEIVERSIAIGGAISPDETDAPSVYTSFLKKYHRRVTPFDSFALQLVLDRMCKEAGVEIFLYTKYVDSVLEDGAIDSIVLAAPEGLVALKAKLYVDCTGNADVAEKSGVETWWGSRSPERFSLRLMTPMTRLFLAEANAPHCPQSAIVSRSPALIRSIIFAFTASMPTARAV